MRRASFLCGAVLVLMGLGWLGAGAQEAQPPLHLEEQARAMAEKGVDFLYRKQKNGYWAHLGGGNPENDWGATALCGLALLLADKHGSQAATERAEIVLAANSGSMRSTYTIALTIIFLEKRGNPLGPLVGKLLSGQNADGSWGYLCPAAGGGSDNSNTQLATLALLVLRIGGKADGAVDRALDLIERRFRSTQRPDGGWPYAAGQIFGGDTSLSMTCAGLLGLAAGVKDFAREVVVKGSESGKQAGSAKQDEVPAGFVKLRKDPAVVKARDLILSNVGVLSKDSEHLTYVLWSIERIAFIYGENTFFGDFDWYAFGVKMLGAIQQADGSWSQDFRHGAEVDTAFALLFIKRANLLFVPLRGRDSDLRSRPAGVGNRPRPPAGAKGSEQEAKALAKELESALGPRVDEILELMASRTSSHYRDALAEVIENKAVRLSNREKARRALADWMSGRDPQKLAEYLHEENPEFRLAAARGIAIAGHEALVPELIERLSDREPQVSQAAHQALKSLTKQKFGPDKATWKNWYAAQPKKP